MHNENTTPVSIDWFKRCPLILGHCCKMVIAHWANRCYVQGMGTIPRNCEPSRLTLALTRLGYMFGNLLAKRDWSGADLLEIISICRARNKTRIESSVTVSSCMQGCCSSCHMETKIRFALNVATLQNWQQCWGDWLSTSPRINQVGVRV